MMYQAFANWNCQDEQYGRPHQQLSNLQPTDNQTDELTDWYKFVRKNGIDNLLKEHLLAT